MDELIARALDLDIKPDTFCHIMITEWDAQNPILEEYINFVFHGFEHLLSSFDFREVHSWDFVFNQSFLQYARFVEDKSKIDYIINKVFIPRIPILKMVDFRFDTEIFLDGGEYDLISDLTGYLEEATMKTFKSELNGILCDPSNDFNKLKYKVLLHSVIKSLKRRSPKYIPFAYVLLNTPIDFLVGNVIYSESHAFFDDCFARTVENTFNRMIRPARSQDEEKFREIEEILASIVPASVYEGRPVDGTFTEIMNYYGSAQTDFIELDPLDNYFLEAVEDEESDKFLLIANAFETISDRKCYTALRSTILRGDLRTADFIIRNGPHNSLLMMGIGYALSYKQKEIFEFLMRSEKAIKESMNFDSKLYMIIDAGWFDLADEILSMKPYQLHEDRNVLLNLIQNGHDAMFKKVVPFIRELQEETVKLLFTEAIKLCNVDLMNFMLENMKVKVIFSDFLELIIENNHLKAVGEIIHLYPKEYLVTLALQSIAQEKIEMSEAFNDYISYYKD